MSWRDYLNPSTSTQASAPAPSSASLSSSYLHQSGSTVIRPSASLYSQSSIPPSSTPLSSAYLHQSASNVARPSAPPTNPYMNELEQINQGCTVHYEPSGAMQSMSVQSSAAEELHRFLESDRGIPAPYSNSMEKQRQAVNQYLTTEPHYGRHGSPTRLRNGATPPTLQQQHVLDQCLTENRSPNSSPLRLRPAFEAPAERFHATGRDSSPLRLASPLRERGLLGGADPTWGGPAANESRLDSPTRLRERPAAAQEDPGWRHYVQKGLQTTSAAVAPMMQRESQLQLDAAPTSTALHARRQQGLGGDTKATEWFAAPPRDRSPEKERAHSPLKARMAAVYADRATTEAGQESRFENLLDAVARETEELNKEHNSAARPPVPQEQRLSLASLRDPLVAEVQVPPADAKQAAPEAVRGAEHVQKFHQVPTHPSSPPRYASPTRSEYRASESGRPVSPHRISQARAADHYLSKLECQLEHRADMHSSYLRKEDQSRFIYSNRSPYHQPLTTEDLK